jgi:hypothetical protein
MSRALLCNEESLSFKKTGLSNERASAGPSPMVRD